MGQYGQLISGEGKFLSQKQVFVLERVAKADRIIGADRANDAGIEEAADGVLICGRHDTELQIADRAHIECDAAFTQKVEHRRILDGTDTMLDALRSEFFHDMAYEIRSAELSSMRFGELSDIPRPAPVGLSPIPEWRGFCPVEVDPIQTWPSEGIFKYGSHFLRVAIMVNAEKDPHFKTCWHGGADGVADLAAVEVHEVDTTRGKTYLHVADIPCEAVGKDSAGALVVACGGNEKISDIAEKLGFEVGKVAEAEIRLP